MRRKRDRRRGGNIGLNAQGRVVVDRVEGGRQELVNGDWIGYGRGRSTPGGSGTRPPGAEEPNRD